MLVTTDLLKHFKLSIGDLNFYNNPLDEYYTKFLNDAQALLLTEDISEANLKSEAGVPLVCLYAEALMNKTDIANNPTITLLRAQLSILTKGDKVDV